VILFVFTGCGNFFTSRMQDINAYFNTYYNASHIYDKNVAKLEQSASKERNPNRFLRINVSQDIKDKFADVVEKCSKILQYYPESVFFDDAMFMIGNAYYLSGEYFRAERKYVELRQNYPNGDLFAEATLALAKTYYQMRKYPKSLEILGDSAALALMENNDFIAEGFCLKGQIFLEKRDYEKAIQNFLLATEFADNNLLQMQSALQLGQTYELMNNFEGALSAYKILVDDASDYLLEVRGKIRYTVMLSKLEKNIDAIEILEEMRDDRRNKEFFPEIDFHIGNVLKNNGDFDLAEEQFFFVDTTYARTDASAKSNFQLGVMNEYIYSDFNSALKYYSKAKGEFLTSEITDSAKKKFDVITSYVSLSQTISKFDSLVFLKEHPEEIGRQDSIRRIELAREDSIAKFRRDSLTAYIADSLLAIGIDVNDTSKNEFTSESKNDSIQLPTSFYDSSIVASDSMLKLIPGKKEKNFWDEAEESEEVNNVFSATDSLTISDSLSVQNSIIDSIPVASGPEWLKDTIKTPLYDLLDSLAFNQYEMGLLMLAKLQLEDSAHYYFQQSLYNAPESYQAPKVLFSIAEYYRTKDDSLKKIADTLYQQILDKFPHHPYANVVRRMFGLSVADSTVIDSLQMQYDEVEKIILSGNAQLALNKLLVLSECDSTSFVMPKIFYAIGWICENALNLPDSAFNMYKRILQKYPTSVFSKEIQRRVSGAEDIDLPFAGTKKYRTDPLQISITFDRVNTLSQNRGDESRNEPLEQIDSSLPDEEPDTDLEETDKDAEQDEPPF